MKTKLSLVNIICLLILSINVSGAEIKHKLTCLQKEHSEICNIRLYHYPIDVAEPNGINAILVQNTNNQEIKSEYIPFDTKKDKVAFLFLVDTSDPKRQRDIKIIKRLLTELFKISNKNDLLGLATFDSQLKVISPIGSSVENLLQNVETLKATGLTTELYKSVQDAIVLLNNPAFNRKVIVLISDGKKEDTAYNDNDIISLANKENIIIYSIGFLAKPNDTNRQTLVKLAEETGGAYFEFKNNTLDIKTNFFDYAKNGGTIKIDLTDFTGKQNLKLNLKLDNNENLIVSYDVELPVDLFNSIKQNIQNNYFISIPVSLTGLTVLILSIRSLVKGIRFLARKKYATLTTLNDDKKIFNLRNSLVRIGRSSECDIQLKNDSVSNFHASIKRNTDGKFIISDLGSSNGTGVNGILVKDSMEIVDGNIIEIAEVRLKFSVLST